MTGCAHWPTACSSHMGMSRSGTQPPSLSFGTTCTRSETGAFTMFQSNTLCGRTAWCISFDTRGRGRVAYSQRDSTRCCICPTSHPPTMPTSPHGPVTWMHDASKRPVCLGSPVSNETVQTLQHGVGVHEARASSTESLTGAARTNSGRTSSTAVTPHSGTRFVFVSLSHIANIKRPSFMYHVGINFTVVRVLYGVYVVSSNFLI